MNELRKERFAVSNQVKCSRSSLLSVLTAVGVLCAVIFTCGAATTNQTTTVTNAVSAKVESKKHKILKFLFDGVPDEGATNKVTKVAPRRQDVRRRPSVLSAFHFSQSTLSNLVVHPPFAKNDCQQCHGASLQNPVLKMPQEELCLQCHQKNFAVPMPVKHKPVALGQCVACHDPHKSPNKKLLRKAGNDLCLKCHATIGQEPVKHQAIEMNGCLECHLPHGGPNKFLTKFAGKDVCYQCHDDFGKTAKFVHAPVEAGECTLCHNPHSTKFEKLLVKSVAETCYQCHDDFQTRIQTAKSVHAPVQNGECTMCHTPHASNERFLLAKSGSTVCAECHEPKEMAAIKGHAGAEGQSCTQCHNPHFSEQLHLLKPVRKELTKQ